MFCERPVISFGSQVHHLIALKEDVESRMRREEPDAQLGSTTPRMQAPITTNDAVVDIFFNQKKVLLNLYWFSNCF